MWVIGDYEAVALFSLKPAAATASGGKTLLVPTPYAVKMALLDIACRIEGAAGGEAAWGWLRGMGVALRPSRDIVVNNTFMKILRPRRNPAQPGSADEGFFGRTIAYREYLYLHDPFALAVEAQDDAQATALARWLLHLNYLGRRGSFIQLIGGPQAVAALNAGFVRLDQAVNGFSLAGSVLLQLDDAGDDLTFSRASIYSGERISLGKHRILRPVALPYRRIASSRGFTHYRRSDAAEDEA